MYRSLCDKESYIDRVKKLIQIRFNKKLPVSEKTAKVAIRFYKEIEKRKKADVPGFGMVAAGSLMFAYLIHRSNVNEKLKSVTFEENRHAIGQEKEAYLMSDIQANRIQGKCFYLCSSHSDSAEDHKDYQGKLYIDENCNDKAALKYAKDHGIKSYQWVIGKPVYMVTRPNCRHYFKALSFEQVSNNTVKYLTNKYDMHRKIGDRPIMQTLSTKGQRVEIVIKSYEERLKLHQAMYKARPNEFLKSAIHKDNLLLQKWKKIIK